jgi:hypothetical protein
MHSHKSLCKKNFGLADGAEPERRAGGKHFCDAAMMTNNTSEYVSKSHVKIYCIPFSALFEIQCGFKFTL